MRGLLDELKRLGVLECGECGECGACGACGGRHTRLYISVHEVDALKPNEKNLFMEMKT